jgi:hypothetical protein
MNTHSTPCRSHYRSRIHQVLYSSTEAEGYVWRNAVPISFGASSRSYTVARIKVQTLHVTPGSQLVFLPDHQRSLSLFLNVVWVAYIRVISSEGRAKWALHQKISH